MKIYFITLFTFFCIVYSYGQSISQKKILKKLKAKDIEFGDKFDRPEMAHIKMKSTKKWGLYELNLYEGMTIDKVQADEIIPPQFDSIGWFNGMVPYTIVKNNNLYGILLNPYEIKDAANRVECIFDAIKTFEDNGIYFTVVKKNKKWGLWDWFGEFYVVSPSYDSPENVPLVFVPSWAEETFKSAKHKLKADLIEFDKSNGDGVFRARISSTSKWGMYQYFEPDDIQTLIPPEYDSVHFIPYNGRYSAVYKNNKVGFYLSYWSYDSKAKQTVPCIYDDYKPYNADGIPKLAVKKNDKWGWVNWLTGEEKSEFKYETLESLPYPYFKQNLWFE